MKEVELRVLTYNVAGLPFPARRNRTADLRRIAADLAEMRERGEAPDIVLLQEAFSKQARKIGARAGYPHVAVGPKAREKLSRAPRDSAARRFLRKRSIFRGERGPRLLGSGLHVLSDFPIVETLARPFRRRECAGFDCLARKGVMIARVEVPGLPAYVDIVNTHMNARKASRAPRSRTLYAHQRQTDQAARFITEVRDDLSPLIIAGDFNMRASPTRFEHFAARAPFELVHQYCAAIDAPCDVMEDWRTKAPWLESQDLQGFADGVNIIVRPIRVEPMFDGAGNGSKLSDHIGHLVTYRISWNSEVAAEAPET